MILPGRGRTCPAPAAQTKKEGHRCPSRYGWIWRKSGIGQSGAKGCAGSLGVAVGGAVGHDRLNDQTGTGGLGVLGPGADPLAVTPAVGAEQANGFAAQRAAQILVHRLELALLQLLGAHGGAAQRKAGVVAGGGNVELGGGELVIPWSAIEVVGEDLVLVRFFDIDNEKLS